MSDDESDRPSKQTEPRDESSDGAEGDDAERVDAEDLDEVIAEIETKLERLDERRRDLEDKIEFKRARVREINETIQNLEEIEAEIEGSDSSEE